MSGKHANRQIVRHCPASTLARCISFSSSSRVHSVFLIRGSSHSSQRALQCFADLRGSREATRAHSVLPYFITAAFRISSSEFFQAPPFIYVHEVENEAQTSFRMVEMC